MDKLENKKKFPWDEQDSRERKKAIEELKKLSPEKYKQERIKIIIAREGLVIVGIIVIALLLINYPSIYLIVENFISKVFRHSKITWLEWNNKPLYISIPENIGWFLLLLGYPSYLLIRFIGWAIRTLKEK